MAVRGVLVVGAVVAAIGCGGGDDEGDGDGARVVPSGERSPHEIAFIRYTDPGGDLYGDVLTMNVDGSDPTNLTKTRRASESDPAWSRDGRLIAFSRQEGRSTDIWVMNADGSDATKLTDRARAKAMAPAWSPDGERIAFVQLTGQVSDIWVMARDGSGQKNLTRTPTVSEYLPDWSPDGKLIVFDADEEIAVMEPDGSHRRSLTRAPLFDGLYMFGPVYSPSGRKIAFFGSRNSPEGSVWMMNADGSAPARVRRRPRGNFGPTFSPDGKRIAIGDGRGFFILRADGRGRAIRLPGGKINDQGPAWSP